jgi:hypothetical protein
MQGRFRTHVGPEVLTIGNKVKVKKKWIVFCTKSRGFSFRHFNCIIVYYFIRSRSESFCG